MLKRKLLWCLVISCFLLLMFGTGSKAKGQTNNRIKPDA